MLFQFDFIYWIFLTAFIWHSEELLRSLAILFLNFWKLSFFFLLIFHVLIVISLFKWNLMAFKSTFWKEFSITLDSYFYLSPKETKICPYGVVGDLDHLGVGKEGSRMWVVWCNFKILVKAGRYRPSEIRISDFMRAG